ncbi:MAG: hypothetical protein RLZZ15_3031 [Verrucomicrobiota bacterium]
MGNSANRAPAVFWRAFCFSTCLVAAGLAVGHAATAPAPAGPLAQIGLPDAAESARILERFRRAGLPGTFYWELELQQLPRRGATMIFKGRLWGAQTDRGPVLRLELADAEGRPVRLLIVSGSESAVWRSRGDAPALRLDSTELFLPAIPGVEITAFDLQRPFVFWPDVPAEKIVRKRGRPAHLFTLRPPAASAAALGDLAAVRLYLDAQFNQSTEIELLARDGRVTKTISVNDLKNIGGQHILKSLDVRNETTRDKTRLLVTAAALDLALPPDAFAPASLAADLPTPPADRLVPLPK